ncbi:MAG: hypothetical protein JST67_03330 [Bacteroidetes bacterium]|nr:hypothetical protein [Bacteroidota bacterium]
MQDALLYNEKQYLGRNRAYSMVRTVLALLCFVGYYWSENPKPVNVSGIRIGSYPAEEIPGSGHIFFVLGVLIMLLSVVLMYILHIQTQVYPTYVLISGFWGARKVKIDFRTIHTIKKLRYKKNILRRPMYNLCIKEVVKFYTSGDNFVELKDKDGFTYRIGTQFPHELFSIINQQVNKL